MKIEKKKLQLKVQVSVF